ncbi:MAG: RDD family protein [Actinomycetota bacterium]
MPDQAAFGRRLVAVVVDWFMCLAIAHLIVRKLTGGAQFIPLGIFFVEVSVLTTLVGASVGQRLLRLRVIDATTGGRVTAGRVILRTFP